MTKIVVIETDIFDDEISFEFVKGSVGYEINHTLLNSCRANDVFGMPRPSPVLSKASLPIGNTKRNLVFKKASSAVKWAAYDVINKVLTVRFSTDTTYEYQDMEADFVSRFENAESPGKFAANELYMYCGKQID